MAVNDPIIGIDLGTTFSCVGIYVHDNVEIVPTKTGEKTLKSRVYFEKDKTIVGDDSEQHALVTVYNSKRFIGKKYSEISQEDIKNWSFKIEKSAFGDIPEVVVNGNRYTATQISSLILKELKELADERLNKSKITPTNAVITVPAYFNEKQREETKKAAELANLRVLQLINEPTAAAFAYCDHLNKLNDKRYTNILIYDFGGGTFDVSVVKVSHENKTITVLKTDGDNHLGGEDIDQELVQRLSDEWKIKTNKITEEPPKEVLLKLKRECEKAKRNLSFYEEADISYEGILTLDDGSGGFTLARDDFLAWTDKLLDRTFTIVESVVKDVGVIDYIVLVGGSSKIPYIEEKLSEMFPTSEIKKDINSEEVVAIGATLYANGKILNDYKCVDIISHSLSTDIKDGKSQMLFPKNSVIPSTKILTYANADDSGFSHIGIYEGENRDYASNKYLGGCNIPITSGKPGTVKFTVIYKINKSGVIEITAKEESPNPHEISERIELNESV